VLLKFFYIRIRFVQNPYKGAKSIHQARKQSGYF
jgi:hypothetical protein